MVTEPVEDEVAEDEDAMVDDVEAEVVVVAAEEEKLQTNGSRQLQLRKVRQRENTVSLEEKLRGVVKRESLSTNTYSSPIGGLRFKPIRLQLKKNVAKEPTTQLRML